MALYGIVWHFKFVRTMYGNVWQKCVKNVWQCTYNVWHFVYVWHCMALYGNVRTMYGKSKMYGNVRTMYGKKWGKNG